MERQIAPTTGAKIAYSVQEAATLLGCSERLLRKEIALGNMGSFKMRRLVKISSQQIQDYISKNSTDSASYIADVENIFANKSYRRTKHQ